MRQLIAIYALIMLSIFGSAVVYGQDATTTVVEGTGTELAVVTEISYGDTLYQIGPDDGSLAVGFVSGRTTTTEGSTLDVVLMIHDSTGWRVAGVLTGEATGELASAVAGDVVTLSVIGGEE